MKVSSHFSGLLIGIAIASFLAGCVSANRNVTMVQQNNNQLLGRPGTPTAPSVFNKTTFAGKTIEIIHVYSLNPDCSQRGVPNLKILQQPSHGQAVLVQREDFPTYPPNHPNFACNKTKVPVVAIDYTPSQGFTGSDLMSIEAVFPSGKDSNEVKVQINVK